MKDLDAYQEELVVGYHPTINIFVKQIYVVQFNSFI